MNPYSRRMIATLTLATAAAVAAACGGPKDSSIFTTPVDDEYTIVKGGVLHYQGDGEARLMRTFAEWDDPTAGSKLELKVGSCLPHDDETSFRILKLGSDELTLKVVAPNKCTDYVDFP